MTTPHPTPHTPHPTPERAPEAYMCEQHETGDTICVFSGEACPEERRIKWKADSEPATAPEQMPDMDDEMFLRSMARTYSGAKEICQRFEGIANRITATAPLPEEIAEIEKRILHTIRRLRLTRVTDGEFAITNSDEANSFANDLESIFCYIRSQPARKPVDRDEVARAIYDECLFAGGADGFDNGDPYHEKWTEIARRAADRAIALSAGMIADQDIFKPVEWERLEKWFRENVYSNLGNPAEAAKIAVQHLISAGMVAGPVVTPATLAPALALAWDAENYGPNIAAETWLPFATEALELINGSAG